jgi:hypothetical protein
MTKRKPAVESLSTIIDELTSFLEAFDPGDAEEHGRTHLVYDQGGCIEGKP